MALQFPIIYLLKFNLSTESILSLERQIGESSITYDIAEAEVVLGNLNKKARAQLELRGRGLFTEEVSAPEDVGPKSRKRRKLEQATDVISIDSSTESDDEAPVGKSDISRRNTIKVLRLDWYKDSVSAGKLLPIADYLVYEARVVAWPKVTTPSTTQIPTIRPRARPDTLGPRSQHTQGSPFNARRDKSQSLSQPILLHETTSEHEEYLHIPPLPSYLEPGTRSCQRPTPYSSPNDAFIAQLKKIQQGRLLGRDWADDHSEHAYPRAIAALQAYPYTITSSREVGRLPYCGPKYELLYQEWRQTGRLKEADDYENDERLKILREFYEIFDVAEKRARQFYARGLRSIDDICTQCWGELQNPQKIGIKYYDDFLVKIPRHEVEKIASIILKYANEIQKGFQMVIVGGYRRGKELCGDVDVILTHPDEEATDQFITYIFNELYGDGWIQHPLRVQTSNSDRGQETLNWKGSITNEPHSRKTGFCTLDKALVVWQDVDALKEGKTIVRRRVDIIISPWKTAGCAIIGWSGGKMFEKDIRSYCREVKRMKFDSSGLRTLGDGSWVDLEAGGTDLLDKEKKVFEGLGLEWREPTERCTG